MKFSSAQLSNEISTITSIQLLMNSNDKSERKKKGMLSKL